LILGCECPWVQVHHDEMRSRISPPSASKREAPFARALHQLCLHSLCQAEGDGSGCDDEALEGALDDLRATDAKHRLACVLTRAARLDVARGLLTAEQAEAARAEVGRRLLAAARDGAVPASAPRGRSSSGCANAARRS